MNQIRGLTLPKVNDLVVLFQVNDLVVSFQINDLVVSFQTHGILGKKNKNKNGNHADMRQASKIK